MLFTIMIVSTMMIITGQKERDAIKHIKIKDLAIKYIYSKPKKDTPAYNKTLCKWGEFERAKTTLKMLLATWFLVCFFKRFRSFEAKNLGSVGQRAAKLLAVKVGGLKKKSAAQPRPHSKQSARIRERAGSNQSQSLMAGNFAALLPTDPKFLSSKDLNL